MFFSNMATNLYLKSFYLMRATNKQLSILSEAEQAALYEIPDFDDDQRLNYLNLTPEEQVLKRSRANLSAQVHCAI